MECIAVRKQYSVRRGALKELEGNPPGSSGAGVEAGKVSLALLDELQRGGVHAITKVRGLGAVIENMAQVSVALRAFNFGAGHSESRVVQFANILFCYGRPEAWPSRA